MWYKLSCDAGQRQPVAACSELHEQDGNNDGPRGTVLLSYDVNGINPLTYNGFIGMQPPIIS
jgi:hypothetical protein